VVFILCVSVAPAMTPTETLTRADHLYQQGLPSGLTDQEFDQLCRETGYESFTTAELPSLSNAICQSELMDWIDAIPARHQFFYLEPKVDGVSCLIEYRSGQPVQARTRKLDLARLLPALPAVSQRFSGVIRGELWHPGGRPYAAGRVRACDTTAGLRFQPFCVCEPHNRHLANLGFHTALWCNTTTSSAVILRDWQAWREGLVDPTVPTDGLVVKLALADARCSAGETTRAPMWALALK
jgi:hypothetical protein